MIAFNASAFGSSMASWLHVVKGRVRSWVCLLAGLWTRLAGHNLWRDPVRRAPTTQPKKKPLSRHAPKEPRPLKPVRKKTNKMATAACPAVLLRHPFFVLKSDFASGKYRHEQANGVVIGIAIEPDSECGRPTLGDRDLLIYAITLIKRSSPQLPDAPQATTFPVADFLAAVGRSQGGSAYDQVKLAAKRLSTTRIKTTVPTGQASTVEWFSLCQAIVTQDKGQPRTITITLCEWLWRCLVNEEELLSYNTAVFSMRPFARRVWDIARVYCGQQQLIRYRFSTVVRLLGSSMPDVEIRRYLKRIKWLPGPGSEERQMGYAIQLVTKNGVEYVHIYGDSPRPQDRKGGEPDKHIAEHGSTPPPDDLGALPFLDDFDPEDDGYDIPF